VDSTPGLAELRSAILERAGTRTGRVQTDLDELWLYRHETPPPMTRVHATGMRLGVLVQGEKVVRFEAQKLRYVPGSYLVITEDADFDSQVVRATPDRLYLALGLELPPDLIVDTLVALDDPLTSGPPESVPPFVNRLDAPMTDALGRLLRASGDDRASRLLAPLFVKEIVTRLLLSESATSLRRAALRDGDQIRIQRAMAFMRERSEERLSVERIARHVAMSPSHFAHRFRSVARTSPIQYLKSVRLRRARVILLSEGARPAEVAARVGYASVSHFSRDFKARFGQSPAAYGATRDAPGAASSRASERSDPAISQDPASREPPPPLAH